MKALRRSLLVIALLAATATSGVVTAGSASADRGPCYNRGGYSFVNDFGSGSWRRIDVYRGSGCSGDAILQGRVAYVASSDTIVLTAYDLSCDNTGLVLYTHGPSVSTAGCHAGPQPKSAPLGAFGNPKNFWVRVGGTTNSNALAFPI
jgi:hypothetical protein